MSTFGQNAYVYEYQMIIVRLSIHLYCKLKQFWRQVLNWTYPVVQIPVIKGLNTSLLWKMNRLQLV